MGRKSMAEKIFEQVKEDHDEELGTCLVLYDFKGTKGTTKFWTNMQRAIKLFGGSLVQYSVFKTNSKRSAITVLRLAKHYGAETILYGAKEMDLN